MASTAELEQLREEAAAALAGVADAHALEAWRVRYLGMKGAVRAALGRIKSLPPEQRREYGRLANEIKRGLTAAYEKRKAELGAGTTRRVAPVDMTLPGEPLRLGHRHIITQTIEEIVDIFARMGFTVAYGPEVEDERHNFEALNIPEAHPARDPLDNFFITPSVMLRSQTSTVQIRVMESQPPPVRVVSPGRVYRPDTVDATHSFMFHQLEGLYVDEGVSMADLKSDIDQFCKVYFGPEVRTRFRPSFFPFTEPSAEVDMLFHYEDGSSAWIELGGCGMVDPNVLDAVGYDSERYTGWAFGLGIERMVMRKYNIPDIRLLFENDVRFLRQF
ncbi:MAG: phenylalanine--tRNA ligase subunit alpha [Planctomycetales bacterium 4484_123]|nr:MAG: phenylalanine--tRNA ligase subunit alpha [Planctomycetales bacterium 4484_123]